NGVSVGINSLVFSIVQRLTVGVGALGFVTGPYVELYTTITSLDQSSIAMRPCTQGTLSIAISGGIGYGIPNIVAKVINFFLGLFHVAPVPATGNIVNLPNRTSILDHMDQMPPGCASQTQPGR